MNILAPFSSPAEVPELVEAGAKELYCGLAGKQWLRSYSYVSNVNLRHDKAANLRSFEELSASVEQAHAMDAKVFLTLNAHFYSGPQLPEVMRYAGKAVKAGVDELIVADAAIIPELKKEFDIGISLSTANPAFNNSALDFFKWLGVNRVVFPRHLTVREISGLAGHAKKIGLQTECFVLNVICPNIDGLCTFQHIVDESVSFAPLAGLSCRMPFKATASGGASAGQKLAAESHVKVWGNVLSRDCGICALPFFKRFGINTVKIAGRGHSTEKKLADVKAVASALAFAESKKFREKCRELYFGLFQGKCDYVNCYYAGVGLE